MKTNMSEQELFTISGRAAGLSNAVLESIATDIAVRPEFPGRLSENLQMAFARTCFQLAVRTGKGDYSGFQEDTSMQSVGDFYLESFCPDVAMRDALRTTLPHDATMTRMADEVQRAEAVADARQQVLAVYESGLAV